VSGLVFLWSVCGDLRGKRGQPDDTFSELKRPPAFEGLFWVDVIRRIVSHFVTAPFQWGSHD